MVDEAVHALTAATSACPELLARLAEDDLFDPEARQGADPADTEARRSEGCAARAEPPDARRTASLMIAEAAVTADR